MPNVRASALESGKRAVVLTPHDSNTFEATRAIHANESGTIVVRMADDTSGTVSLTVVAGVQYSYSIILLHTSSDAEIVAIR